MSTETLATAEGRAKEEAPNERAELGRPRIVGALPSSTTMPSLTDFAKLGLLLAVALGVGWLSAKRRANRVASYVMGGLLVLLGIPGLLTGRFHQRWDVASPLTGPLAVIASLTFVGLGAYVIYLSILQSSRQRKGMRDEK